MPILEYDYDVATDILTVEGQQYSGALFRSWAVDGFPDGQHFSFHRANDEAFTVATTNCEARDQAFAALESALREMVPEGSTAKTYDAARAALALAEGVRNG